MKICFLAPANSAHIVKWSRYFVARGHEVHVVSFVKGSIPGATVHYLDCGASGDSSDAKKLNYMRSTPTLSMHITPRATVPWPLWPA